jgi:hypothetical protein
MTDTSLVGRDLVIFGRGFGIQQIKTTQARSKATISVPGLTLNRYIGRAANEPRVVKFFLGHDVLAEVGLTLPLFGTINCPEAEGVRELSPKVLTREGKA